MTRRCSSGDFLRLMEGAARGSDLVKAHPGEEPEEANALGDVVKRDLVQEIAQGCWVEFKTGRKLLLTGYAPPENPDMSFDELVKFTESRKILLWLSDGRTVIQTRSLEELAKAEPKIKTVPEKIHWMKATDLFEQIKRDVVKAAPAKASTPQAEPKRAQKN